MTNFRMWLSYPLSQYVLTMVIVLALVIIAWLLLRDRHSLVGMLVLLIPVLYVPGYLESMRSHSQIHSWFVFRDVAMGFAVTAAVCLHFLEEKVRPHAVPVVLRVRDDPAGIRTTEGSDDTNGAARPSMS